MINNRNDGGAQNVSGNGGIRHYPNGTPFSQMTLRNGNETTTDMDGGCFLFSVASFNLLAPCYVRPHDKRTGGIQPFAAFEWINEEDSDEVLGVQQREHRLLKSLQSCQADVICLQELQLERSMSEMGTDQKGEFVLRPWILPLIEHYNYKVCLPPQEDLEVIAERNVRVLDVEAAVTCAVLYRADKLEEVELKMNDIPNTPKETISNNNTCVTVCLRSKKEVNATSAPIVVTSVHLDAMNEAKRVGQLARCLRQARSWTSALHKQQSENFPVIYPVSTIIAGDMNTEIWPGSCLSAFLADASVMKDTDDETLIDHMTRQCALALRLEKDALPTMNQMKQWQELYAEAQSLARDYCVSSFLRRIPTGTTRSAYDHDNISDVEEGSRQMAQWRLDHILYTQNSLEPCALWSTLEEDSYSCQVGLPNRTCGSDHLPIAALFRVQPKSTTQDLDEAKYSKFSEQLDQMDEEQHAELTEQQSMLDDELAQLEDAQVQQARSQTGEDGNEVLQNNKKRKKIKKKNNKGTPPKEIQEFIRKKRSILRALLAQQRQDRKDLVDNLGDMERLFLEEKYGFTVKKWVEEGAPLIT